nr:PREDICTED: F-box/LRR-repeat protein At5g63520-like [Daucus carota subsp. sativus]
MGNNRRKTVTIIDHSLLSPPKLASALSFNHSFLDVLEEVYSKVFFWGTEIGPHFAIVSLGPLFMLDVVLQVIIKKLGSTIPIICTLSYGLMGRDVATHSFKEVPLWRIEDQAGNAAVLLTLGFLPGMRVAAVTMSQSKKGDPYVDKFVTIIRECSIIKLHVSLLRLPLCYPDTLELSWILFQRTMVSHFSLSNLNPAFDKIPFKLSC